MTVRRITPLVLVLALAGCKSVAHGSSRNAYVADAMREYPFPRACEALWVDAMRVLAQQGFVFNGKDRELVGQENASFIGSLLARGHSTTVDDAGVFETETDSDKYGLRYIIRGKPGDKGICFVTYTSVQEDKQALTDVRVRDYQQEFKLLTAVDPGAASRIYDEAEKAR